MPILITLLELWITLLGVWVLVFSVGSWRQLSISTLSVVFVVALTVALAVSARRWLAQLETVTRGGLRLAVSVVGLGCLLGLLVLVASRPDSDDAFYIGPLLADSKSPSEPFTSDPFDVTVQGEVTNVPFLAEFQAYEAMAVVLGRLVGCDPLAVYHNYFAFWSAVMWAVVYALLFRFFRVPRDFVLLALLTSATFLMLDGNLHRSFGNFSLLRIWQGKVLVFAVLNPAFLWLLLRAIGRPSAYRYSLVAVTAGVGFFFNRSSILLFVVLGVATALAYLIAFGGRRRRRLRALTPLLLLAPPALLGVLVAAFMLSKSGGLSSVLSEILFVEITHGAFQPPQIRALGATWQESLYDLLIGSPKVLLRDLYFLIVLPALVVPRPLRRLIPLLVVSFAVLALSPLSGPVWHFFSTNVYWRMYYGLPLPLCVGLAALLLRRGVGSNLGSWRKMLAGFLAVAFVVLGFERATLSAANQVEWKRPLELRLPAEPHRFTRKASPILQGRRILAPSEVATVFALTERDSIRLALVRPSYGTRQWNVNRLLSKCKSNERLVADLEDLVEAGVVDAVVAADCTEHQLRRVNSFLRRFRLEPATEIDDPKYRLYWVVRLERGPDRPNTGS